MDDVKVLELELELKEERINLKDSKTGKIKKILLKELSGSQRDLYLNQVKKATEIKGGIQTVATFDAFQARLLALCMYEVVSDDGAPLELRLVPQAEIQQLPSSTQQVLFNKAQALSALDKDGIEDAKNG